MTQPRPDPGSNPRKQWIGDKAKPGDIKPIMRAAKNGDYNRKEDTDEQRSTGDTPA